MYVIRITVFFFFNVCIPSPLSYVSFPLLQNLYTMTHHLKKFNQVHRSRPNTAFLHGFTGSYQLDRLFCSGPASISFGGHKCIMMKAWSYRSVPHRY